MAHPVQAIVQWPSGLQQRAPKPQGLIPKSSGDDFPIQYPIEKVRNYFTYCFE